MPGTKSQADSRRTMYNPHVPSHKTKGLTDRQKKMLDEHAKHHTKAHIDKMIMVMTKEGKSFAAAHKIATEKVGNGKKKMAAKKPMAKKGLTEKQKKLPKKLQEAIMKKSK
mgnify:CR=1 FL=1|tara:strand:+ start:442 stop:774 length:333 start_codon:yes stop_codon:yes gene_type:complete